MLILVLEEQIYYTKHLTMDLGNKGLKMIITDRHIVYRKNGSFTINVGKLWSGGDVFFKYFNSKYM